MGGCVGVWLCVSEGGGSVGWWLDGMKLRINSIGQLELSLTKFKFSNLHPEFHLSMTHNLICPGGAGGWVGGWVGWEWWVVG